MNKFFVFILFLSLMSNGFARGPRHSSDFTSEWSFTKGIEGPAVDRNGNLFVVNFKKDGTIGKVTPDGKCSVFCELPEGSIGNGIRFDRSGNMYIADYTKHNILIIRAGEANATVLAHENRMSQPNDLAISPRGILYVSDPNWKDNTGQLWMIGPDHQIRLLESHMGTTNGIEVSPDGKFLYVNESFQRRIWRYSIQSDGSISHKVLFVKFDDYGMDGMRCDKKGNLYLTRYDKGTIAVISPQGKIIDEIILKGKEPSNITFGGPDGRSCFVTLADRGCLETFRAQYPGREFVELHR